MSRKVGMGLAAFWAACRASIGQCPLNQPAGVLRLLTGLLDAYGRIGSEPHVAPLPRDGGDEAQPPLSDALPGAGVEPEADNRSVCEWLVVRGDSFRSDVCQRHNTILVCYVGATFGPTS